MNTPDCFDNYYWLYIDVDERLGPWLVGVVLLMLVWLLMMALIWWPRR